MRCINCGKLLKYKHKYCSNVCQWEYYRENNIPRKCDFCEENRGVVNWKNYGLLCPRHQNHARQYGKILKRTMCDKNEIINCGDYYEMKLYNKYNNEIARTKFDKKYIDSIRKCKWGISVCGGNKNKLYVSSNKLNGSKIRLHTLIMGKKDKFVIDHINSDTLDNREKNLQYLTHGQNIWKERRQK